jgi:hypothetical protein
VAIVLAIAVLVQPASFPRCCAAALLSPKLESLARRSGRGGPGVGEYRVSKYADQTGSVYTSAPPKAIHAVIPKDVLGERVLGRIESSMRTGHGA